MLSEEPRLLLSRRRDSVADSSRSFGRAVSLLTSSVSGLSLTSAGRARTSSVCALREPRLFHLDPAESWASRGQACVSVGPGGPLALLLPIFHTLYKAAACTCELAAVVAPSASTSRPFDFGLAFLTCARLLEGGVLLRAAPCSPCASFCCSRVTSPLPASSQRPAAAATLELASPCVRLLSLLSLLRSEPPT